MNVIPLLWIKRLCLCNKLVKFSKEDSSSSALPLPSPLVSVCCDPEKPPPEECSSSDTSGSVRFLASHAALCFPPANPFDEAGGLNHRVQGETRNLTFRKLRLVWMDEALRIMFFMNVLSWCVAMINMQNKILPVKKIVHPQLSHCPQESDTPETQRSHLRMNEALKSMLFMNLSCCVSMINMQNKSSPCEEGSSSLANPLPAPLVSIYSDEKKPPP